MREREEIKQSYNQLYVHFSSKCVLLGDNLCKQSETNEIKKEEQKINKFK
jgi:hypothetical protein